MSRPGSPRWWQDTALITLGGVALAIWLWDGPVFYTAWIPVDAPAPAPTRQAPQILADMLDAGCLTQDHLRALAQGDRVTVNCAVDAPAAANNPTNSPTDNPTDNPREPRLFP